MSQTPEEIALERIRQAAESGAEFLDFSDLDLPTLPPEIVRPTRIAAMNRLLNTCKSCGFILPFSVPSYKENP